MELNPSTTLLVVDVARVATAQALLAEIVFAADGTAALGAALVRA